MMKSHYLAIVLGLAAILNLVSPVYSEESPSSQDVFLKQLQELEKLRQENPVAYRKEMESRRVYVHEQIQKLPQARRAELKQFFRDKSQKRQERMKYFRQRHPEIFERFMKQRMDRFRHLAEKNPERFRNFLVRHPKMKERLEQHVARRTDGSPVMERGGRGSKDGLKNFRRVPSVRKQMGESELYERPAKDIREGWEHSQRERRQLPSEVLERKEERSHPPWVRHSTAPKEWDRSQEGSMRGGVRQISHQKMRRPSFAAARRNPERRRGDR